MSEIKIKGIVLSSIDYKERDKLITIFSLERGLISAKLVGVKNPKAKMKPLKEIFCFADFILNTSSKVVGGQEYFTVTSANIIDTFYDITADIDKFYAGCTLLEIIRATVRFDQPNEPLFIELLKALKSLAYENIEAEVVLIKFLIKIFEALGYQLALEKCSSCGQAFIGKRYFDHKEGEIVCTGCKGTNSELITPLIHSTLRLIANTDYVKLSTLKLKKEGQDVALDLLIRNFSERFDCLLRTANKLPK